MFGLVARLAKRRPDRLTRLVKAIESLTTRDAERLLVSREVERVRPLGAQSLHTVCRRFVDGVNAKLSEDTITIDPPDWPANLYADDTPNLIQINLRGRLLLLSFKATESLHSTEDFNRPYVLEGSVRSFNQDLLDHNRIDEQNIYFCPKHDCGIWYYVNRRLYRTGIVDEDFLIREMERLL